MYRYVFNRIIMCIVVILIAAIIIFCMLNILPGDPALVLLGEDATYEQILEKREAMGLNGPLLIRLGKYLYNFFIKFDFGTSWTYGTNVVEEMLVRIPRTIFLSIANLLLSVFIGVPVGISCAMHRGKWQDRGVLSLTMLLMAIPGFWLNMELIVFFSLKLNWLPAFGFNSWKCYILPIVGGALAGWSGTARQTRQSVLEVMRADYIVTARIKGVSEKKVIYKHMLPNALMPVITMVGGMVGGMIAGSIQTERTFSIPGVGMYMLTGINNRDYPVVEAVTIILAAMNAVIMLLVDLTYGFIDPRIKAQYISSVKKGRRMKKNG